MKQRILIAEDDSAILLGLTDLLEGEGFAVECAVDGQEAIKRWSEARPDLILLDVMMPEKSGLDVCREIRRRDPVTPVIMLTAKGEEIDKVVGLELGADDYVVKPFGANELIARIRAVMRRGRAKAAAPDERRIEFSNVSIDPRTLKGKRGAVEFDISPRELGLMRLFTSREGDALDRSMILDELWGVKYEGTTRTLDQHIAGLRKKIEKDPAHPRHILTVHGVGYRFSSGA